MKKTKISKYIKNIKIDKDVPLREQSRKKIIRQNEDVKTFHSHRNVYPYKQMLVNDSFFIPFANLRNVLINNYRYSKSLNTKYVARSEVNGIRVWRIK
jgi:hypothetical protein